MSAPKHRDGDDHFVYRIHSADGDLLYIGRSKQVETRIKQHVRYSRFRNLIASHTADGPFNFETACDVERDAIRRLRPQFNMQAPGARLSRTYRGDVA